MKKLVIEIDDDVYAKLSVTGNYIVDKALASIVSGIDADEYVDKILEERNTEEEWL